MQRPLPKEARNGALTQFMERVHLVNGTHEYAYRVEFVVLFGNMLSDVERLGDVDIAIRLQPKADGDAKCCPRGVVRSSQARSRSRRKDFPKCI